MLKTLIILLFYSTCSQIPCDISKEEVGIALNVLHSQSILEIANNELNINFPEEYRKFISNEVKIGNRIVKLYTDKISIPLINFTVIKKEEDNGIKILFTASEAGHRYSGKIIFECKNEELVFKDIHFLSEID